MTRRTCVAVALGWVAVLAGGADGLPAQRVAVRPGVVGAGGVVGLPYTTTDGRGTNWRVYQNGNLRQDGNVSVYGQGAALMVNGNYAQQNNNQGRLDPKTGELLLENLQLPNVPGLSLTRRILVHREEGYVRYVDVLRNAGNQPVTANLQLQTNLNYGVSQAQMVPDPKRKDQNVAWVGQTGANVAAVEVFAGKGAKVAPTINWQPGNNVVQATLSVAVPPGKEVALMHLHLTAPTQDAGANFVKELKESRLVRDLPVELRKILINFAGGQFFVGDVEILRGDLLDVVELRGGDQVKGTLKEPSFKLQTFYGAVELPVEKVVGLLNVGQFRPRQLVVTSDGQIFGGKLSKETINLELSSGQTTQVPLSQIARVGYRKRTGEPEEWKFEKPMVLMRTGERVAVQMPAGPLEVITRYGRLTLKPETVAGVVLQSEEHGVHEVVLTDGSRFAGLLAAESFEMRLEDASGGGASSTTQPAGATVKFPASAIARLQLAGKIDEAGDDTPVLSLVNEDLLVGSLTGQLKVDTAFDTIAVNAAEIRSLTHPEDSPLDVQIELWDGTTLSGLLQQPEVQCRLSSGVTIPVPVPLVRAYNQPSPQPSGQMVERIKATAAELNAEDWRDRDRAEARLTAMGPAAAGVLKELRANQPPEAQARIDSILKELERQRKAQGSSTDVPVPAVEAFIEN